MEDPVSVFQASAPELQARQFSADNLISSAEIEAVRSLSRRRSFTGGQSSEDAFDISKNQGCIRQLKILYRGKAGSEETPSSRRVSNSTTNTTFLSECLEQKGC